MLRQRSDCLHAARRRLEREVRPADDPAGGERVAGTRRVDHPLDGQRRPRRRRRTSSRARRASRSTSVRARGPPTMRSSSSLQKTTSGASASRTSRKPPRPEVADRAPRREVDADARPPRPCQGRRALRREADRLAQERVAREVQVRRSRRARPGRARPARAQERRRGRSTSSGRRPGATSETTTPFPEADYRPDDLDAAFRSAAPPRSARRRRRPRLPTKRARPPSATTQAATFAACPPGDSVVRDVASAPGASGCSSRTMTSSRRSPSVQTII